MWSIFATRNNLVIEIELRVRTYLMDNREIDHSVSKKVTLTVDLGRRLVDISRHILLNDIWGQLST